MTFTTLFPTVVYTTNLNPCEQVRSEMLNHFETYVLDNCIGDDDDANKTGDVTGDFQIASKREFSWLNRQVAKHCFDYLSNFGVDAKLVKRRKAKPKRIIVRETTTLNNIIENSPYKKSKLNLLSIDIENHEYEALKNFKFKKYEIDCIVIEILNTSNKEIETHNQSLDFVLKSNVFKLLKKNNYKLINWVNSDLIFFHKKSKI